MKNAVFLSMSLSLGMALTASAHASSITFSYTSGNLGQGTVGNSIVETISGETVTATAWSVTGNDDTTFQAAALGQYSNLGLGDCNLDELAARGGCQPPQHEVDDNGQLDFVLFTFSEPVTSVSITIDPVCDCNTNASYFAGNNFRPNGETLASFGTSTQSIESMSDETRTIVLTGLGAGVNSILFGADVSQSDNYFKIESITVTPSSIPEPATFGLAAVALIGIGLIGRKHRNNANKP